MLMSSRMELLVGFPRRSDIELLRLIKWEWEW